MITDHRGAGNPGKKEKNHSDDRPRIISNSNDLTN